MAESLHSDTSHVSDYVADRGPAKYFHGRKRILGNFDKLVKESVEAQGGSTFLIQGAPGAGKTALLEEIAIDAMENQWDVFEINLGDLYNPVQMAQTLGKPYISRKQTAIKADAKVLATERIKEVAGDSSVSRVLEKMNPNRGVLLILDEAQRIGRFSGTPNEIPVMGTLETLHNGKLPHPVILLAAGLGRTKAAFGSLGISRFKGGCFVELGALGKESERAVIRDWLTKDGGAKGDPSAWIDAIAQKAHGWPQHILSYVVPAKDYLIANNGIMTDLGLEALLEAGERGRQAYYEHRVKDFDGDEVICLSEVIADIGPGMPFNKELVEAPLVQRYGPDKGINLFQKFLEKGVIAADGFLYSVPIPSMHDWMKLELERTQERLREMEETRNRNSPAKTICAAQEVSPSIVVREERKTQKPSMQSTKKDRGVQGRGSYGGLER